MLPEKLASMVTARDDLAAASLNTPRIIARVRGKALHHGCAITFIAVAAPSLSQLMHNRETGTGPMAVPSLDEEKEEDFDWDRELLVSERARQALECMRAAMEKYGNAGQPLWPGYRARSMVRFWQARSGTLAFWSSRSTPACTAGRQYCARRRMSPGPASRSWGATGPPWSCSGRPSSTRLRYQTVRSRRCIGRRSPASSLQRQRASYTRSLITPF
jgi:hypothetical protein